MKTLLENEKRADHIQALTLRENNSFSRSHDLTATSANTIRTFTSNEEVNIDHLSESDNSFTGPRRFEAIVEAGEPNLTAAAFVRGYKLHGFVVQAPLVILRRDGTFVELQCYVCTGNMTRDGKQFLRGTAGMQAHLRTTHGIRQNVDHVVRDCAIRTISDEEVMRIEDDTGDDDLLEVRQGLRPYSSEIRGAQDTSSPEGACPNCALHCLY